MIHGFFTGPRPLVGISFLSLTLSACGYAAPGLEASAPEGAPTPSSEGSMAGADDSAELDPAGVMVSPDSASVMAVQASDGATPESAAPGRAPAPPPPPSQVPEPSVAAEGPAPSDRGQQASEERLLQAAKKMVDIEAHLTLEVDDIEATVVRLRKLANGADGQVIGEQVSTAEGGASATVTLRIPAARSDAFLSSIEAVGRLKNRQVLVKDIGKEYFDAGLRLANLEVARQRYEAILARATSVDDMRALENELTRLRGEIEQIKGQLRWLRDRAARATVIISLYTEGSPPSVQHDPEAKLYPGLRVSYAHDFRPDGGATDYLGGEFVVGLIPEVSLELTLLRGFDSEAYGIDALFLTLGARIYSEFLGDGERPYLNPYLGFRGGYARVLGQNEALAGGALGVELLKGSWYVVDVEGRGFALFGSEAGGHVVVEPTLGAAIAF